MTNAQWIFEAAMHLMDEGNESTGKADTADTREYKNRTLPILNVLRMECFPASDTYLVTIPGKRPVCQEILSFQTPIPLDDRICQGVLPYGLAAHLLLSERQDDAAFFQQCYEEKLSACKGGVPGGFDAIQDVYGGVELGQFGSW